jgi:hypothetical protein
MKVPPARLTARRVLALGVSAGLIVAPVTVPSLASAKVSPNAHFALGHGSMPDLVVGKDGTAYVAWVHEGSPGVENQIQYCRVPRGKRACVGTLTFTLPGQQIGERPYVFVPDAKTVLILSYRCCFNATESPYDQQTLLLRSTDGGRTFGAPMLIGTHSQAGDAKLGAGGALWTIDDTVTFGETVQRAYLDGSSLPAHDEHARLSDDEYGGTLATLPGGGALAATWDFRSGPNTFHVYRYSGTGDANTDGAWSLVYTGLATKSPKSGGKYTQLAQGKRGIYLFTQDNEVFGRFQLRKWTGNTFAAPVFLTPAGQDNIFPSFWQDAAGRLSVAYSNDSRVITYRSSDRSGFAAALALKATEAYNLRGATAADGGGFVAYDANSGTGTVSLVPIPTKRVITETVKGAKLSGKVVLSAPHQPVVLEKKTAKGWVAVKSTKLTAAGKYAFTVPAGKATWRAVAPAVEGYAEADGKAFGKR